MEDERYQEFYSLSRMASVLLHKGNTPDRTDVNCMIQMLVLPTFAPMYSWEICRDRGKDNPYFAVHTIWQTETDVRKLENPIVRLKYPRVLHPTIEINQYLLETLWVEAVLVELKKISIPVLFDSKGVGLDGVNYEIKIREGMWEVSCKWWWEPPFGMHSLNIWMQDALIMLEQFAEMELSGRSKILPSESLE